MSEFIFELIVDEELAMARLLRKKLLAKVEKRSLLEESLKNNKSTKTTTTKPPIEDLLDSSNLLQSPVSTASSKILPYLNTFAK